MNDRTDAQPEGDVEPSNGQAFEDCYYNLSLLVGRATEGDKKAADYLAQIAVESCGGLDASVQDHPDFHRDWAAILEFWPVLLPAQKAKRQPHSTELMDRLLNVGEGLGLNLKKGKPYEITAHRRSSFLVIKGCT